MVAYNFSHGGNLLLGVVIAHPWEERDPYLSILYYCLICSLCHVRPPLRPSLHADYRVCHRLPTTQCPLLDSLPPNQKMKEKNQPDTIPYRLPSSARRLLPCVRCRPSSLCSPPPPHRSVVAAGLRPCPLSVTANEGAQHVPAPRLEHELGRVSSPPPPYEWPNALPRRRRIHHRPSLCLHPDPVSRSGAPPRSPPDRRRRPISSSLFFCRRWSLSPAPPEPLLLRRRRSSSISTTLPRKRRCSPPISLSTLSLHRRNWRKAGSV